LLQSGQSTGSRAGRSITVFWRDSGNTVRLYHASVSAMVTVAGDWSWGLEAGGADQRVWQLDGNCPDIGWFPLSSSILCGIAQDIDARIWKCGQDKAWGHCRRCCARRPHWRWGQSGRRHDGVVAVTAGCCADERGTPDTLAAIHHGDRLAAAAINTARVASRICVSLRAASARRPLSDPFVSSMRLLSFCIVRTLGRR
jgi:hypothetical protein